jgi:hypothetical protein
MLSPAHLGYSLAVEDIIPGELTNAPSIIITAGMRVTGAPKCASGSPFWCASGRVISTSDDVM